MKPFIPLVACFVLWPLVAWAQAPDPGAAARLQLGPFAVTPSIGVNNLGVDTNVFNESESPKSDFTATITPAVATWLRFGPARLDVKLSATYLYFAQYSNQRGWSTDDGVRIQVDSTHLRPWAGGSYRNLWDRPGYEIDQRVRHTERAVSGGVDLLPSELTTLGVSVSQVRTEFEPGDTIGGSPLIRGLNRTTTVGTASLRYALTPLTTVVMAADVVQERFEFSSFRDSDGFRFVPGVEFAPSALITGSAHVGFRLLRALTAGMPDYAGPVASVSLGYTLKESTRFAVGVRRDIEYSFEVTQPYYLLTGVTGSVRQAVAGPWSVEVRASTQHLAYQTIDPTLLPGLGSTDLQTRAGRVDIVRSYGGGVGYTLGPSTLLGVNVDYSTRHSEFDVRQYQGLRVGGSLTYGF